MKRFAWISLYQLTKGNGKFPQIFWGHCGKLSLNKLKFAFSYSWIHYLNSKSNMENPSFLILSQNFTIIYVLEFIWVCCSYLLVSLFQVLQWCHFGVSVWYDGIIWRKKLQTVQTRVWCTGCCSPEFKKAMEKILMIQIKHNRVLYLYLLVMNNTTKSEEIAIWYPKAISNIVK